MPSILTEADKDCVKRTVPKSANKIQAVAVVRLYIAYPNTQQWVYTGLQGAGVLANDLVGNTFWIKLVDISVRIPAGSVAYGQLSKARVPIGGSYGIRRSTTLSTTIKIEPSSIHSSSKNALQASHS